MALCTYEKFSTINPALLKNADKKTDGKKRFQTWKNILLF